MEWWRGLKRLKAFHKMLFVLVILEASIYQLFGDHWGFPTHCRVLPLYFVSNDFSRVSVLHLDLLHSLAVSMGDRELACKYGKECRRKNVDHLKKKRNETKKCCKM
eukprot:Rmarinus@m.629